MYKTLKRFWQTAKRELGQPLPLGSEELYGELVNSDDAVRRFGYILIIGLFGTLGIWAISAPLESAARGAGVVQVDGTVS